MQFVWDKGFGQGSEHRRALRIALATAATLVILALIVWQSGVWEYLAGSGRSAESLKRLPALPADIEAHGSKSSSILPPNDARARNAAVPFAEGALVSARPFAFAGSAQDRARALECLAAAALYEAGDDTVGQAAVAQVVLNRVRHPAYPGSVCGVVYQGSERSTGCQFTFTCDGSLRRQMSEAAWARARAVANRAMAGWVDKTVGLATHYHTDWVFPYWSPQLRKLAKVGTHLFFGWPGGWGKLGAFKRIYRGNEPGTQMALTPGANGPATADPEAPPILGLPLPKAELPGDMARVPLYGNRLRLVKADGRGFGLLVPSGAAASSMVNVAMALCDKPGPCQVAAWGNEDDIPGHYPIPAGARGTMVFEYARAGTESGTLRFDCDRFTVKDRRLCMATANEEPAGLSGVRWKEAERPLG